MKPLFDKTLDELREAFVRARFAEPNIFGRPDIEEWLEGQRKAYYPDWSRTGFARFGVLIARYAGHPLTGEHLNKYATPLRRNGDWKRWVKNAGPYAKIVLAIINGGGKLYRSDEGSPIFSVDGEFFAANPVLSNILTPLNNFLFLDAVFSEWKFKAPKATVARDFICNAMSRAIDDVRQAAERDFDEACAVSADGTKIVHAKYVFVAKGRVPIHGTLFDAHTFATHKIRCPKILPHESIDRSTLEQIGMDPRKLTLDLYLGYMLRHWSFYQMGGDWMGGGGALLVNDRKCGNILPPNKTILFVSKRPPALTLVAFILPSVDGVRSRASGCHDDGYVGSQRIA